MIAKWKAGFKKLLEEIKPMPFKKKVDHIWTYYKEHLFMVAFAGMLIFALVSSALSAGKEIVLSGMLTNVGMSMDGYSYLTDRYFEEMGGNSKKQEVGLSSMEFKVPDLMDVDGVNESYVSAMSLISMVENKMVDYVIMDEGSMEYFMTQDFYLDLRKLLTAQELEQWKAADNLVFAQVMDESGNEVTDIFPLGLKITDLDFAKDCVRCDGEVYLVFIANTPRMDACRQIFEDILAWESSDHAA